MTPYLLQLSKRMFLERPSDCSDLGVADVWRDMQCCAGFTAWSIVYKRDMDVNSLYCEYL